MAHTITSMALFCDFENIALGVRDAKYAKFDIDRVLERLLLMLVSGLIPYLFFRRRGWL